MLPDYEAAGNLDDWPKNEPGKPTRAAVFGVYHADRGRCCEILWHGAFPNLQPAMYWAAKKEMEAVRRDKWIMATRVLWQHELTPEDAVQAAFKVMSPQVDQAIRAMKAGKVPKVGDGPMRPVDPKTVEGYYAELFSSDDPTGDAIASFAGPAPGGKKPWGNGVPMEWAKFPSTKKSQPNGAENKEPVKDSYVSAHGVSCRRLDWSEPAATLDEVVRIYLASIPPSGQKPAEAIRAMSADENYQLWIAEAAGRVTGFAAVCSLKPLAAALLEYLAVDESQRGRGMGAALVHAAAESSDGALLVEVESDTNGADPKSEAARRIAFYRRLGCRRVEGCRYQLPLPGSDPRAAIDLMVHSSGTESVPRSTVRQWLGAMYARAYRQDPHDPRIDQMLAGAADPLRLI